MHFLQLSVNYQTLNPFFALFTAINSTRSDIQFLLEFILFNLYLYCALECHTFFIYRDCQLIKKRKITTKIEIKNWDEGH